MSQVLDVKGLNCPLPVLRTKKAMKAVAKGQSLTVEATDPATQTDIPALCEAAGFTLLSVTEANGVFIYNIQQPA
jgi:tRNA 2-thiouridine synthesizing protein A